MPIIYFANGGSSYLRDQVLLHHTAKQSSDKSNLAHQVEALQGQIDVLGVDGLLGRM